MADCCIPYKEISYYSNLIIDYLNQKKSIQYAYNRFPSLENFKTQLEEKKQNFSTENRRVLVDALQQQYQHINISEPTATHLEQLAQPNTFTITTGHQLNLFTGPLYFFYKIISVINLTKELTAAYPDYNFVPVYWLASEDHDFEEINYFNYGDKKISWNTQQSGAVGRFSTDGLEIVWNEFSQVLNSSKNADYLREVFKKAYVEHKNLTEATRYLANEFFKKYGLVIIDGDDTQLKQLFAPYVKDELLNQTAYKKVSETAQQLATQGYKIQVNPREINLFYLKNNLRERIIAEEKGGYTINNTPLLFSKKEILAELTQHPERFSPNAIMRPLYQEVILPNLCYVGGSGELAYWLELKAYFEAVNMTFPVLLMRNSALLRTEKQQKKQQKLSINNADLFLKPWQLAEKQTRSLSTIPIDFSNQKKFLQKQFKDLHILAEQTDPSFEGAVAAQEKKQLKGLTNLEKRLLRAQKKKLNSEVERSLQLQAALFPSKNLQERTVNFSVFYEVYGEAFVARLFDELKPLKLQFNLITV